MKRIIVTTGEPAGIGPDVVLAAAQRQWATQMVTIGNKGLLEDRAAQLGLKTALLPFNTVDTPCIHVPGNLSLIDIPQRAMPPGHLNSDNASYVMAQLEIAPTLVLTVTFRNGHRTYTKVSTKCRWNPFLWAYRIYR